MIPYIGNGAYCYSNSIAMLLAARGINISPSYIEPLTGVGLGAFWIEGADLIFFSSLATPPDVGISQALKLLGFDFDEKSYQEATPPPWESFRGDLAKSPAILGPLDMGFLHHNPSFRDLGGSDHYVLAYGMNEQEIYLHDPDGFPHVTLALKFLEQAWKAENIQYRRGYYRYWTGLQRREQPTGEEIYNQAVQSFQVAYRESDKIASTMNWPIGRAAILICADHARRRRDMAPRLKTHLAHFALKLGARRALDFASFFETHFPSLAALKRKQAKLFGQCHTLAARKSWTALAGALQELANLEDEFRTELLNHSAG